MKPGFKESEYSSRSRHRVKLFSIVVYAIALATACVTTILYNPDNLFGPNSFVATPVQTFQTRDLRDNCETLVLLFDSTTESQSLQELTRSAKLRGSFPNIRQAILDETGAIIGGGPEIIRSSEVVDLPFEIYPNVTLSWSGDVEICKAFMRPIAEEFVRTLESCAQFCGASMLEGINYTAFSNFQHRATRLLNGDLFQGIPIEFEYGFFDVMLPFGQTSFDVAAIQFEGELDVEAWLDFSCTAQNFGAVNLASLPPFACTSIQFRGWLEVLALTTSNVGLVYAVAVVIFSCILQHPEDNNERDRKVSALL